VARRRRGGSGGPSAGTSTAGGRQGGAPRPPEGSSILHPAAEAIVPPRPRRKYKPDDPADPKHLSENRPKLRKSSQRSVFKDAKRAPNGEDFVCPSSGEIIACKRDANGDALKFNDRGQPDPDGYTHPVDNPRSDSGEPAVYNFGHVEDAEYRRLIAVVEDHPGTVTNRQFRDEYNQPGHYQVEHPPTNVGHGSESTKPGYGHYDHLRPPDPAPGDSPMDTSRPRLRR
jgi:hypothetical protein